MLRLSKIGEKMRFHSISIIASYPAAASQVLAEYVRFLGKRQKTLLFTEISVARISTFVLAS